MGSRELDTGNRVLLGVCREGRSTLETESIQRTLSADMFFVVSPGCRFCMHVPAGRCDCLWLEGRLLESWLESSEELQRFAAISGRIVTGGREDRLAARLASTLMEAADQPGASRSAVTRSLILMLLEWAAARCEDEPEQHVEAGSGISDALTYVAQHYSEELRIAALAEHCHISEPHFRRLFHRRMGMGPLTYINRIRIMKACELLKKRLHSVEDIARLTGFHSMTTFERNFRQIIGMNPMQWRSEEARGSQSTESRDQRKDG